MKKIDRVIGIDLGNGLTNVRSVYPDGSPYVLTLPSAFSYASQIGDAFGDAGEKYDVDYIKIDNVEYVWGEDVHKLPQLVHTASSSEQRYQTQNYRNFIKMVLGRVAKDIELTSSEQVHISTGVPADQTVEEVVEAVKEAFYGVSGEYKGLHQVEVNGELYTINVANVSVTSQPLATVLSYYLTDQGTIKDKGLATKKIAIIDIGGGTTDLDTLINFNRQKDHISKPRGFRDVYKAVREYIKQNGRGKNIELNDYQLLHLIQEAEKKAKAEKNDPVYIFQLSDKTEPIDFTQGYHAALSKIGMEINQFISDQWSDLDSFDRVFLVGGSAKRLAPYIEILANPDFPQDPGLSNVEGYYNFGVSKSKRKSAE